MKLQDLIGKCRQELLRCLTVNIDFLDFEEFKNVYEQVSPLASSNKALSVLAEKINSFINSSIEQRSEAFLELNSVVERISRSLVILPETSEKKLLGFPFECVGGKELRYSEVKHLIQALGMKSGARLNLIRESIIQGTYKSLQLLPYFVDNIDIRHASTAELIVEDIIPYFGRASLLIVRSKVSFVYGAGQERLFRILLRYMTDEEAQLFSSEALSRGDLSYKKAFLKRLRCTQLKKSDLEPLLKSRSRELRDLAAVLFEKYT